MKLKAVPIRKKDPNRILLTELLPFELPIFFSNERLYRYAGAGHENQPTLVKRLLSHKGWTVPFTFRIQRGDGRLRSLSIIHPATQLRFVPFYAKWDAYILNQCSKSEFSLRYPTQVGSVYFERERKEDAPALKGEGGDLAPGADAEQRVYASSYFYYTRFNQVWKFFDSTEFRRIEQDFRHLLRLDVSKCFQSIYTHSISWAIRGKPFAKKHQRALTFDGEFDGLMQHTNWNETNGIVIGPEVSRIFAEVILQQADADIKAGLLEKKLTSEDVCIRRYVDDYFIFHNSDDTAFMAKGVVERVLEDLKLALNDAKEERLSAPLITGLSVARESVRDLLRERVGRAFEWPSGDEDDKARPSITERSADYLIKSIKGAIKSHGGTYSTISPYALGSIAKLAYRGSRRLTAKVVESHKPDEVYRLLSYVLEVSFFLYRMDLRVNTTYAMSRILTTLVEIADKFGSTGHLIRQEVVDHGASVLRQARRASVGDSELASLLASLFHVGGPDAVSADEVEKLLFESSGPTSNYFRVVTALFCAQDKPAFDALRLRAQRVALEFLAQLDADATTSTEASLLFFDFVACPYVDNAAKVASIQLVSKGSGGKDLNAAEIGHVRNFVEQHLGFCDWEPAALPAMLRRKELKPAYD